MRFRAASLLRAFFALRFGRRRPAPSPRLLDPVRFAARLEAEWERDALRGGTHSVIDVIVGGHGAVRRHVGESAAARLIDDCTAGVLAGIRATDVATLVSDAEFCVLLPETGPADCFVACDRLRAALERTTASRGWNIRITLLPTTHRLAAIVHHAHLTGAA